MINFSNEEFPFYEFPDGIKLTLLAKNNDSSKIISNRAVVYNDTDIIDLRGDVVLTTNTNDTLFTDQLYYDQKKEWLFTDSAVKFRTTDYITYGNGFDSNQDFTNAQVLEVTGSIFIEQ
jgi:LPS export ABC transporter protein LptC